MSESNKFTKGPWSLDESRHAGCINRLNPFRHIGMVSAYQATKEDKEENRANALLISAAPDLLDALENLLQAFDGAFAGAYGRGPLYIAANSAINKARGQQ